MNYRSIADLANAIDIGLCKIPNAVDLIVGVPRSGMLAASIIALKLNLPLTDLNSFIENRVLNSGSTRNKRGELKRTLDARNVLIVDDSIYSGGSIKKTKDILSEVKLEIAIFYCAIFVTQKSKKLCDIFFEIVEPPRMFEWNVMHHPLLNECCVDIDGILCDDPSDKQNDDGVNYIEFIRTAQSRHKNEQFIGHLVTSRLEKYREQTEYWLKSVGVNYGTLHMLDLPDAITRRKLSAHGSFKGEIYKSLKSTSLFIESEIDQAASICAYSGKPVLCLPLNKMFYPGGLENFIYQKKRNSRNFLKKLKHKIFGK